MIVYLILIFVLISMSALYSGAEISYASASEIKLRKMAEAASKGRTAKLAFRIYQGYDKALISILIGNNLVNIASSAVATVIAMELIGDAGAGVATLVMTVVIIIFGEITPKILASRRPEDFARLSSLPIKLTMIITSPVVFLADRFVKLVSRIWEKQAVDDAVTEDDLETMIETVEDEGVVDEETADLLQSALDFDDVLAYEIITPRVDMQAINIDDDENDIINRILKCKYSRIPVYKETPDHIKGFVLLNQCLKSLASGSFDLEKEIMPTLFVHKTMPLPEVLEMMRSENCHIAIVTDEYGGTMGMLTMEDVLEQIVGDIWDEKDVIDEEFVELSDEEYEVDADMRLEDLFDELELDDRDFDDDNATLGGWATEMIGDYPDAGDSFTYGKYLFTVTEVNGMRVMSLKIKEIKYPDQSEDPANVSD